MIDPSRLAALRLGAVVAPAGHGKTELIANVAAQGRRALVLTHTHAGVDAIRSRVRRMGLPRDAVVAETIAGWCMRYANSFPGIATPPKGLPERPEQWDQLYQGATRALNVSAVRQVVAASYDRLLIDEYQDCNGLHHALARSLSTIVPTLIFGDPMQGIFEFGGATLSWERDIHPAFPLVAKLESPHRWAGKNPELGAWISDVRKKLIAGETIDLADGPVTFREETELLGAVSHMVRNAKLPGTHAAIHCRRPGCNNLAKATHGQFQAIEEMASGRLRSFAGAWDVACDNATRLEAVKAFVLDCVDRSIEDQGHSKSIQEKAIAAEMNALANNLAGASGAASLRKLLALARKRSLWRIYREELWRDAERASHDLDSGRRETLSEAISQNRQRMASAGRSLPGNTISTPLLLKGMEFDHVVVPDAAHFNRETLASAKLFYVAISRATRSLTITSPTRLIQFPKPAN